MWHCLVNTSVCIEREIAVLVSFYWQAKGVKELSRHPEGSKTDIPATFKIIGDKYGRLHPQSAGTGAVFAVPAVLGYKQNGNEENSYIILLLVRWNNCC